MKWIQVKIGAASENIEQITGFLMDHGIENTQIDDEAALLQFLRDNPYQWDYIDDTLISGETKPASVLFWVPSSPAGLEILNGIKSDLAEIGANPASMETDLVDDEDWLNEWKKYFKPVKIGRQVVVRPEWEPYAPQADEIVFSINPGHVFGTGLHQTTQMCIEFLEDYVTPGCSILDLGCGSGILSIIGILLGAGNAFGCDLDPSAEQNAIENAGLNNIPPKSFEIVTGNAISDEPLRTVILDKPKFDIVTANIVADAVIALTGLIALCVKQDGIFISSGIIGQRLEEVKTAVESNGFSIIDIKSKDDWYCLAARYA